MKKILVVILVFFQFYSYAQTNLMSCKIDVWQAEEYLSTVYKVDKSNFAVFKVYNLTKNKEVFSSVLEETFCYLFALSVKKYCFSQEKTPDNTLVYVFDIENLTFDTLLLPGVKKVHAATLSKNDTNVCYFSVLAQADKFSHFDIPKEQYFPNSFLAIQTPRLNKYIKYNLDSKVYKYFDYFSESVAPTCNQAAFFESGTDTLLVNRMAYQHGIYTYKLLGLAYLPLKMNQSIINPIVFKNKYGMCLQKTMESEYRKNYKLYKKNRYKSKKNGRFMNKFYNKINGNVKENIRVETFDTLNIKSEILDHKKLTNQILYCFADALYVCNLRNHSYKKISNKMLLEEKFIFFSNEKNKYWLVYFNVNNQLLEIYKINHNSKRHLIASIDPLLAKR